MRTSDGHLLACFPFFGPKRKVAAVWARLGAPRQYVEPFCGSAAVLLAAPRPAPPEVIGDGSGFVANFWRATRHQPDEVARWADYPVSHVDLGARHGYLLGQRPRVGDLLRDPDWPGDAKVAGWWLWGQCCWIGDGWCDWGAGTPRDPAAAPSEVPWAGVPATGKIPAIGDAGVGIHAIGKVSTAADVGEEVPLTSGGRTTRRWLRLLSERLERVRVLHGDWSRCLNHHYGRDDTAVLLEPPYRSYEKLYSATATSVADAVCEWARAHAHPRVALCGHQGDYDLPGWDAVPWSRGRLTYGGDKTTELECVWYSPACLPASGAGAAR